MEAIRNCCHAAYTYPVSREKLLIIGGGVLGALLVGGLLIVICSSGDEDNPVTGSMALKYAPLIIGQNDLAANLKHYLKNQLSKFNFSIIAVNKQMSNCTKCCTDLTRLKSGMVSNQIWTVSIDCVSSYIDAVSQTLEQIDVIQRLITANTEHISLIEDAYGIKRKFSNSMLSSSIAVSGGHTIDGRLGVLRTYYNLGVRYLSFGNGCDIKTVSWFNATTLTSFGEKVIQEMNRLGMVIDVSRLPSDVQLNVISKSQTPVIIMNANAYNICASENNVQDNVLDKLKEKGGLIMVSFDPDLVIKIASKQQSNVSLDKVLDHFTYLKRKVGAEHIGIGAGFDGFEKKVDGLEDLSKLPVLFDALFAGTINNPAWSLTELKGLAGNNLLRILEEVEKKAHELQKTEPCDDYEELAEISANTNMSCYTDFHERYTFNTRKIDNIFDKVK
ncbi:dipeptidase 1-like [Lycorma delicatula]|uniref:dipeptidase 1-like n=1 Tax=Lycorma delicatula TaxID=130591 RepID=UPI003F519D60